MKKEEIYLITRLRKFKEKSGWSYQKMGSHMGVHSQSVVNWLSLVYEPSPMACEKIQRLLDEFPFK